MAKEKMSNYEQMLEKIVLEGYQAEMKGLFEGRTGTIVEDGKRVFKDPVYRIYKKALRELAILWGNEATKTDPKSS